METHIEEGKFKDNEIYKKNSHAQCEYSTRGEFRVNETCNYAIHYGHKFE